MAPLARHFGRSDCQARVQQIRTWPTIRIVDEPPPTGRQGGRPGVKDSVAAPGAPVAPLDTVPKLLLRNAVEHGARPAIRHKDFGIWQTWTWARLRDEVRALAVGLRKLGLERGDAVAIIGDNRPRLYATLRRRAEPGRHSRARLPGLGGRRDGLRARARRGEVRHRRRTRSRSTSSSPSPTGCRSCSKIIYDEPRGLAELRSGQPAFLRARAGAGPRGDAPQRRAPPAGGSTRSPRARAPTSA